MGRASRQGMTILLSPLPGRERIQVARTRTEEALERTQGKPGKGRKDEDRGFTGKDADRGAPAKDAGRGVTGKDEESGRPGKDAVRATTGGERQGTGTKTEGQPKAKWHGRAKTGTKTEGQPGGKRGEARNWGQRGVGFQGTGTKKDG